MSEINDRILEILKKEGIMPSRFAQEIGVQKSAISHILNGRNKPGYDIIKKILKRFSNISAEWLILGEGEMYKNMKNNNTNINNSIEKEIKKNVEISNFISNDKNTELKESYSSIKRIIIIYDDNTFSDHIKKSLHK